MSSDIESNLLVWQYEVGGGGEGRGKGSIKMRTLNLQYLPDFLSYLKYLFQKNYISFVRALDYK